jgi:hypothetical protein
LIDGESKDSLSEKRLEKRFEIQDLFELSVVSTHSTEEGKRIKLTK